jgi:glucosyl-dolichyl phosphate glucuronosyltransferase
VKDELCSIIVPTRNRARLLPDALTSLLAQSADGARFEIIVVDNNSRDSTCSALGDFERRSHGVLRFLVETRKGVSHARNAGIAASRGSILAFVDDDVRVRPGWLAAAVRILREQEDVHYLGGPVLPLWQDQRPRWLTPDHWSPIAAVDYGSERFVVPTMRAVCLISANLFVRRAALDRVGWFNPAFRRCQDRELMLRLWAAGLEGIYAPEVAADTVVPRERLTRAYHRRWHATHGAFLARMPLREKRTNNTLVVEPSTKGRFVLGVPLFEYRSLLAHVGHCALSAVRLQNEDAFKHELCVRYSLAFVLSAFRAALRRGDDGSMDHRHVGIPFR